MAAPEGYKTLGKIGISYKGDYNINTAYERLDAVLHNGSTYLALVDAPDGAPRDDKINWIYLAKGFSSDIGDSEITFTEAEARENIDTGESVKTVFGKIKKFFTDLTAPAFAQMITSKDDLLATKVTGYVPDAKAVADTYTELNGKLNDLLLVKSYDSETFAIGINDAKDVSIHYDGIDGYKAIACLGFNNNKSNAIFVSQSGYMINAVSGASGSLSAWCFNANHSISYADVMIRGHVLYIKDL